MRLGRESWNSYITTTRPCLIVTDAKGAKRAVVRGRDWRCRSADRLFAVTLGPLPGEPYAGCLSVGCLPSQRYFRCTLWLPRLACIDRPQAELGGFRASRFACPT